MAWDSHSPTPPPMLDPPRLPAWLQPPARPFSSGVVAWAMMLSAAKAEKADATLIRKTSAVISDRFDWAAGMAPVAAIRSPVIIVDIRYHDLLVSVVSTRGPAITL